MNQAIKASLEVAASSFALGALAALQPFFATGQLPAQPQWGSIIGAAIFGGLTYTWHRFSPAPAQSTLLAGTLLHTETVSATTEEKK